MVKRVLEISIPFRSEDRDALPSPRWRSQSSILRFWVKDLDSAQEYLGGFLGFLWVARGSGLLSLIGPSP
jgi:hypothetical protein